MIFYLTCFIGLNSNNDSPVGQKLIRPSEKCNGGYEQDLEKTWCILSYLDSNLVHIVSLYLQT